MDKITTFRNGFRFLLPQGTEIFPDGAAKIASILCILIPVICNVVHLYECRSYENTLFIAKVYHSLCSPAYIVVSKHGKITSLALRKPSEEEFFFMTNWLVWNPVVTVIALTESQTLTTHSLARSRDHHIREPDQISFHGSWSTHNNCLFPRIRSLGLKECNCCRNSTSLTPVLLVKGFS